MKKITGRMIVDWPAHPKEGDRVKDRDGFTYEVDATLIHYRRPEFMAVFLWPVDEPWFGTQTVLIPSPPQQEI